MGYGGTSLFSLVFYAFAAYLLFSAVQRWSENGDDGDYAEDSPSERAAVCKVQVGLLGLARGLQADLDVIARRADTSTPSGLHYLLQGDMNSIKTSQTDRLSVQRRYWH